MPRYVALLRGMNIGRRRMKMADLRVAVAGTGATQVQTLLQSGNVVLSSDEPDEEALRVRLDAAIAAAAGFASPVVLRTRDALAAVVAADPFAGAATDPRRAQVVFLSTAPQAPPPIHAAPPEAMALVGRELHTWHPDGIGRSPLADALSRWSEPGVVATARNRATVTKLLALCDAGG